MGGGADFTVGLEVEPTGAVRGARELAGATKELTGETRRSGEESRKARTATDDLAQAERRRMAAAADMIRSTKAQIAALTDYQRQLAKTASVEAARAAAAARGQRGAVAGTGVDPSSRLGGAMTALLERERQLRASVKATAEEIARNDKVAGNIAGLQARTKAMEGALIAAQRGKEAERAYAEALEVRRQVEASGARPGTDQAAAVEKEVRAQQRLEQELRAVAAARERDRRAAAEAGAQRERVAGEISRLRETTRQLDFLASAHRRGGNAVREANVQLEVRNALLRLGVSAGSADARAIEQQIRRQAQLRQEIDQATAAERRAADAAGTLRNAFFALQGVIATLGLSALVRDAVQVALAMDRARKSLFAATGSQSGAAQEMAFVTAEADRLGLVLTDTAQAYAKLSAASRGTVLAGQATRDIFSAISETATVLGLRADETKGALNAVQQMISKGAVQSEELRGQLGERLPGAYQIAARAMGFTTAQLQKQLELGKVTAAEMLPKLAAELRRTFGSGLANAVNSAQANLNRFRNAVDQIKAALGEGFLSGFLAGFQDLKENLSGEELKAAARDLGEAIGSAMRNAADTAAYLAKNLEFVKAALLAILALKAAGWLVGLAGAIATATGATLKFKAASSNLVLAGGLGSIAVALGIVVIAMDQYISRSRLAFDLEMSRVAKSNEVFGYYKQLRANKVGLTEAEWAYAAQIRQTMATELAALKISLERTKAQYEASKTLNPIKYLRNAGPGRNVLREQVAEQERELRTIENQLDMLDDQWFRLMKLPVLKLKTDDKDLGKTGAKIADLLEGFRRAAEQAERVAAANRVSAGEVRRVTDAIERENAAYQALHSIEGLSAAAKAKLAAVIDVLVGRTQAATRASEELAATRERDLTFTETARQAEASLVDARTQMTAASRELTAQLEAEAIARSKFDEATDAEGYAREVQSQLDAIRIRKDYIAGIELEVEWIRKSQQQAVALRQAEAGLADAKSRSTEVSRRLAVQLEVEEEARKRGVQQGTVWYRLLEGIIALRHRDAAAVQQQTVAQEQLNEALDRQRRTQAEFRDWQQRGAAVKAYGEEIAGILDQYGLLAQASRDLAIAEEALARARHQNVNLSTPEGQDRLRQIQAAVEAEAVYEEGLKRIAAQQEILAYTLEPLKEAWTQFEAQATDALIDLAMGAEVAWEDMAKSLLRSMLSAIVEMAKRWALAQKAMQAEAAQTAAMNAAAANAGGASSLTGAGATVQGTAGTMGSTASTASSAGSMASLFSNPVMMYAAIALAVVIGTRIWQEKKEGKTWQRFHYDDVNGQLPTTVPSYELRGNQQVPTQSSWGRTNREMWRFMTENFQRLLDSVFGETLTNLPRIDINVRKDGKRITAYVGGVLIGAFKEVEDALNAAIVYAMQTADLSGVSQIVLNALRNSTAETVDQLSRDLQMAQEIADLGLNQWQRRMREHEERIAMMRREAQRLRLDEARAGASPGGGSPPPLYLSPTGGGSSSGPDAFGKSEARPQPAPDSAARRILEEERRGYLQLRDDVLAALGDTRIGIQRQVKDIGEALQFLMDNMERFEISAEQMAQITRDVGQRAFMRLAEGLLEFAGTAADRRRLEEMAGRLRLAQLRVEYELIKQLAVTMGVMLLTAEEMAFLDRLFREAGDGSGRGRRGGGGSGVNRAEERDRLRNEARRMDLDAVGLAVDDARQRFTDFTTSLRSMGFSAAELALLMAAADRQLQEELQAIRDEQVQRSRSFITAGTPQGGALMTGLSELAKTQRDLIQANRTLHQTGLLSMREMRDLNRQIREAGQRQGETLVKNAADALLMDLYNLLGEEQLAAQLRFELTVAELQIRKEELRLAMLTLNYTQQQMDAILGPLGDLVGRVIAAGPALFLSGGGDGTGGGNANTAAWWAQQHGEPANDNGADARAAALKRLEEIEASRMDSYQQEVLRITQEFESLRAVLGDSVRLQTALNNALDDARVRAVAGLREFYEQLRNGVLSGGTIESQFQAAQVKYQSLLARVRGGELGQSDNLRAAGDALVALMTQMYGTSTGGFEEMRQQILAQLGEILGDVTGASASMAASSDDIDRSIAATNSVTDAIDFRGQEQARLLGKIGEKLDRTNELLTESNANTNSIAYGNQRSA